MDRSKQVNAERIYEAPDGIHVKYPDQNFEVPRLVFHAPQECLICGHDNDQGFDAYTHSLISVRWECPYCGGSFITIGKEED